MQDYPNILLIAGTGRNSGKTVLACEVIRMFSINFEICAMKISPHRHGIHSDLPVLFSNEHFVIYKEVYPDRTKDSSRMLDAGARKVLYLEVNDEHLPEAFSNALSFLPPSRPLVVESPALRQCIRPGLFIIADHEGIRPKKATVENLKNKADLIYNLRKANLRSLIATIKYSQEQGWIIEKKG